VTYVVRGRWYWTADKSRLVGEGDPEAAFLAYPAGTEIPDGEAKRVGLPAGAAAKMAPKPQDKMVQGTPKNKTITLGSGTDG
jgi:hypothetical protein